MGAQLYKGVRTLRERIDMIAMQAYKSIIYDQYTNSNDPNSRFRVTTLAKRLVNGTPQHGREAEIAQIYPLFNFVKQNVEYRFDPEHFDMFLQVGRLLEEGAGDCDDHTIIQCALFSALGYKTGARVVSEDGDGWHIYALIGINPVNGTPTETVALDSAFFNQPGEQPDLDRMGTIYQCDFVKGRTQRWVTLKG